MPNSRYGNRTQVVEGIGNQVIIPTAKIMMMAWRKRVFTTR